ncbi:unnamed protein product [Notodromas monacha]|uniref:General transcription and DNA repair factor IIH subunit TFB5 n=1 Tax=Notodromas monacha TaxID=399045 RepID=A0A7R9C1N4_9CRUS|nr:unnamed protein product [Notodromas monacha]CAG0925773.1 unnamed protein product [Notodromas monacha]
MVQVSKGVLVTCDPPMRQFLIWLDEKEKLGRKFILLDLDSTHLFISADVVNELMEKVDEWMDRISAQVLERDD